MAYLGTNGFLKLKRTNPEPIVVPSSAVNPSGDYITVNYDDWLLTERIHLIYANSFLQGYVHRDTLDRITLHSTAVGALTNDVNTRLDLSGVNISQPVILAASINTDQRDLLISFFPTLSAQDHEIRLRAWPSTWASFKALASTNDWRLQGELKRWELTRSAPEIDTSALGDKFTSALKAVVSGSGTFDFLVDLYSSANQSDVDPLLRLVHLTEYGSTAEVKLYLKGLTSYETCNAMPDPKIRMNAGLFFYTNILITECSVEVGAEDLVAGSANYVCTGPIRLLTE
jgi:hypothetical protein